MAVALMAGNAGIVSLPVTGGNARNGQEGRRSGQVRSAMRVKT